MNNTIITCFVNLAYVWKRMRSFQFSSIISNISHFDDLCEKYVCLANVSCTISPFVCFGFPSIWTTRQINGNCFDFYRNKYYCREQRIYCCSNCYSSTRGRKCALQLFRLTTQILILWIFFSLPCPNHVDLFQSFASVTLFRCVSQNADDTLIR